MAEENKLEFPVTLVKEMCITCGVRFAIPEYYLDYRKKDHKDFHCPNGHKQHYSGKSDLDTINDLKENVKDLVNTLKIISELEVGAIFNKAPLELAVELSKKTIERHK